MALLVAAPKHPTMVEHERRLRSSAILIIAFLSLLLLREEDIELV